jgi:cold-inducible RNA-binding protein
VLFTPLSHLWGGGFFSFRNTRRKQSKMNVKLYVGNLPKSTTREELTTLFTQAGEVTTTDIITDRNSGVSKGFAFVTMSAQSEAEKAIQMFNAYSLNEQELKVEIAKPKRSL